MSYQGKEDAEPRSDYSYDRSAASESVILDCSDDPGYTVQSEKDDADINVIVERFGLTGKLPAVVRLPEYMELDEPLDFQTALNYVKDSEKVFMEIPAPIRSRFENSPQKYLEFVSDPANVDEMRKLGLAKPAVVEPAKPAS